MQVPLCWRNTLSPASGCLYRQGWPEDEDSMFFQNADSHLQVHTVLLPRGPTLTSSVL
jgi:hypothetical protein